MLLQTNSYIVPKEKRSEHTRLMRRFRQVLGKLGCDSFEAYEQVGANWNGTDTSGRFVQIMRFRDRKHQLSVQNAEKNDPVAQALIAEFCALVNFQYQQQQGYFAVGFYSGVLPGQSGRAEIFEEEAFENEGGMPVEEAAVAEGMAAQGIYAEQSDEPSEAEHGAVGDMIEGEVIGVISDAPVGDELQEPVESFESAEPESHSLAVIPTEPETAEEILPSDLDETPGAMDEFEESEAPVAEYITEEQEPEPEPVHEVVKPAQPIAAAAPEHEDAELLDVFEEMEPLPEETPEAEHHPVLHAAPIDSGHDAFADTIAGETLSEDDLMNELYPLGENGSPEHGIEVLGGPMGEFEEHTAEVVEPESEEPTAAAEEPVAPSEAAQSRPSLFQRFRRR